MESSYFLKIIFSGIQSFSGKQVGLQTNQQVQVDFVQWAVNALLKSLQIWTIVDETK